MPFHYHLPRTLMVIFRQCSNFRMIMIRPDFFLLVDLQGGERKKALTMTS